MKRIFTLVVFVFLGLNCFGQKIRISDTTNRWTGYSYNFETAFEHFFTFGYSGDTTISNVTYSRMGNLLIRDDTVVNKVYCRAIGVTTIPHLDSNETLLYDYNLVVGDTFTRYEDTVTWKHKVVSIDSVLINNTWNKIWKFAGLGAGGLAYQVIEGIGGVNGYMSGYTLVSLYPSNPPYDGVSNYISCFSNRYGQPAISTNISLPLPYPQAGSYIFNNTTSCMLALHDETQTKQEISVVPNPCTMTTQIKFGQSVQNGNLIIYNCFGKEVYKTALSNQNAVTIGKYISTTGSYFYRVVNMDKNQVYSGRFVAQ